jgi:hypothetical protein
MTLTMDIGSIAFVFYGVLSIALLILLCSSLPALGVLLVLLESVATGRYADPALVCALSVLNTVAAPLV